MIRKTSFFLILLSGCESNQSQNVGHNIDDISGKIVIGMTIDEFNTKTGVIGEIVPNGTPFQNNLIYDFDGFYFNIEVSNINGNRHIIKSKAFRDDLTIERRKRIRAEKWHDYVKKHPIPVAK